MNTSSEQVFQEIQAHCLTKDGCAEEYPWGDVAWKVKGKCFAIGGEGSNRFTIKSTLAKQEVLILHPQVSVASYVGRFGWVTIEVVDDDTMALAKDLIDESFDMITRRKVKP